MKFSNRQRYIVLACLAYVVLALAWIFLSDQLLASFMDLASVVWLSSAKGGFFVLVSGLGFYFVLQGVPARSDEKTDSFSLYLLASDRLPLWLANGIAILLVVVVQVLYSQIAFVFGNSPLLILFILPVILAALLGGLVPGLLATLLVTTASAYNIQPYGHFAIERSNDLFHLSLLIINGLTVSLIGEAMHSAKQREIGRRRQLEKTSIELNDSEARFRRLFHDAPLAMVLVDKEGKNLAQNDRFDRLFGYTQSELNNHADWWPKVFPDTNYRVQVQAAQAENLVNAAESGGEVLTGEYRVTCKDGSERLVQMYGITLLDGVLSTFLDVTEARRIEQRLRLWTESFERAQVGLIITDAQKNVVSLVNPAFALQRGYSCDEMVGMPLAKLFPNERQDDVKHIIQTLNETSHGVFETEHLRKDGSCFPVLVDISVLRNQQNRPVSRVAFSIDLTERKRTEQALAAAQAQSINQQAKARLAILNQMQDANAARLRAEAALLALRESEARIKLFIDYAPAALAMFDREMRYLAFSRRWLNNFNLGDRELFGLLHYEVFPEIGETWKAIHQRGLAGEIIRADEDRFIRADGSEQWLRWEVRPWFGDKGAVGGIVIFSEDITARILAKQALRNSEAQIRTLIRTIPDLIWLKDLNGVYLLINPVLERLFGMSASDVLGHTDYDFFDPEQADLFRSNDRRALEAAAPVINEEWLTFADGYCGLFQTVKTPVTNEDGQLIGILGVARDISVLRQAEQRLRESNTDLEATVAERTAELELLNQSLESFVYSVSHDLKAPLRGIEGYSQLLKEDYGEALNEDGRFFIANIRTGVAHMSELIDDLLAYSRMDRRKLDTLPLDLAALIGQVLADRADDIAAHSAIIVTDLSPVWVEADVSGLSLVMRNLLENALKFSAKTIQPRIEINIRQEDGLAIVQVADNGIGFDMMYHDRIFEIFQRLHRLEDYPGTGIGLALVKKAIQRMGGKVWAESTLGQGARFYVQLRLAQLDN